MHGDPFGTILMRKFAARYLTGVRGAKSFRAEVTIAANAAEFCRIVEQLFPVAEDTERHEQHPQAGDGELAEPECHSDGAEQPR
jgi:hypothetical protein